MEPAAIFFLCVLYISFSPFPAWIAARKGRSYWEWFIFSVLFWPIALIAAFIHPPMPGSPLTRILMLRRRR